MTRHLFSILVALVIPATLIHSATTNGSVRLAPSKIEITANPGEIIRREFTITNQSSDSFEVTLQFEDLTTPADPFDGAALAENSPPLSPVTPYLSTPKQNFTLLPSGQAVVPIVIQLPAAMPPGGFYGAAIFSIAGNETGISGTRVVTRLAPLLFLRVNGEAIEAGELRDFNLIGRHWRFSSNQPIFYLTYQNTGTIYLNPYGLIELKNQISGQKINLPIDPWFVLPGATRIREIGVLPVGGLASGWYQARLALNRGFGDLIDKRTINFIIVTPPTLWGIGLGLIILLIMVRGLRRRAALQLIILLAIAGVIIFTNMAWAEVASSTNYRLQADSLNFGGGLSNSTNYSLESTLGELATGNITSTNYGLLAGYQQMVSSFIAITAPSDVTLSGIAGTGASSGSVVWTVTTDNSAGYTLSVKAGSSPALAVSGDSFSDYAPSGANPDYNWSVGASASAFGFSPEGTDIASRYLDNGSSCGTGASNATDQCWDGFSTTNRTIAQSSTSNNPSGVVTTVKLKAEIGNSKTQPVGSYAATLTVTATPR